MQIINNKDVYGFVDTGGKQIGNKINLIIKNGIIPHCKTPYK